MIARWMVVCSLGLTACLAQQYEIGGAAGAGFAKGASVTGLTGSADAGFATGTAFGGWIGHRMYSRMSGEIRYGYLRQDLKLSGGGLSATFKGEAHVVHYDILFHPVRSRSKMQPFVAVGGGFKFYRGTGKEAAYQPLGTYAYLTKTQEWKPMVSAGGGLRITLSEHLVLRTEFRDYITPFPKKVITPASGAKISGWVHDIVPLVGIAYLF